MTCTCKQNSNDDGTINIFEVIDHSTGLARAIDEFDELFSTIVAAAVQQGYDVGFSDGSRGALAATENQDDDLQSLVDADAAALDSVLSRLEEFAQRFDAIEYELGLKYLG